MKGTAIRESKKCIAPRKQRRAITRDAQKWITGLTITAISIALFVTAAVSAMKSVPVNNARCLAQIAKEEHTTLEAFFQNPSGHDALVQALAACAQ